MLTHSQARGARERNFKGVDIDIPRDTLTVITGLSASGCTNSSTRCLTSRQARRAWC